MISLNLKKLLISLALLSTALTPCAESFAAGPNDPHAVSQLSYQQLLERNEIRIAVPYDPTIYVNAKGKPSGISVQVAEYFGRWLSDKYHHDIRVTLVPTGPGKLIDPLDSGNADIAIGYLWQYKSRLASSSYLSVSHAEHQNQVLVSANDSPPVSSLDDLSGKLVCLGRQVRTAALVELNGKLVRAGRSPAILYKDRVALSDQEMLEMANDGLIPYVMGTEYRVDLWKPYLPNIKAYKNIEFDIGGNIGWAIRSSDKGLEEDILAFSSSQLNTEALLMFGKIAFRTKRGGLKDPKDKEAWARFISMRPIFEKYGNQYDLSPLLLASFGFQETALNQALISPGGAIGVMQLTEATGSSMNVGDIHELDANIHAGAKYLNQLVTRNFNREAPDKSNRALFAIAAYNMGPENLARARNEASKRGFNPNEWFLNVEMIATELFGPVTMDYVRNVYKYYVVYQLSLNPSLDVALDQLAPLAD